MKLLFTFFSDLVTLKLHIMFFIKIIIYNISIILLFSHSHTYIKILFSFFDRSVRASFWVKMKWMLSCVMENEIPNFFADKTKPQVVGLNSPSGKKGQLWGCERKLCKPFTHIKFFKASTFNEFVFWGEIALRN